MQKSVELRVSKKPYLAYAVIFLPAILAGVHSVFTAEDGNVMYSWMYAEFILIFLILILFLSFHLYAIKLEDGVLIEKGLLKRTKRAPVSTIKRWRYEVGWPDQRWLWRPTLRPFRRLSIYYEAKERQERIDISLNLFATRQVRDLVEAIRSSRPDLQIPKGLPMGKTKTLGV